MTMNQAIAAAPVAEEIAPTFDHRETNDRPRPVPRATKISDNAAATDTPPIAVAQDTPDEFDSFLAAISANTTD